MKSAAPVVLVLLATRSFAQNNLTEAMIAGDALAAGRKEIAMVKLQRMQTRPNGSQQPREQDRIDQDIAADYQFIEYAKAHWTSLGQGAEFDRLFHEALQNPDLRNEDPFQASEEKTPLAGIKPHEPFDWRIIYVPAVLIGLVFGAAFIVVHGTSLGLSIVARVAPDRLMGGGGAPGPIPNSGSGPSSGTGGGAFRPCSACGGSGFIVCTLCAGRGSSWNGTTHLACSACGGSGGRQCNHGGIV